MVSLIKKGVSSALVLGVLVFNFGVVESNAAELTGVVSFYDGEGHIGSDGTVLTQNDVAVKFSLRTLPKGTPIITTNTTKNITKTLYKWDYGSFGANVILDVQRSMFTQMGGVITNGYFNGKIRF